MRAIFMTAMLAATPAAACNEQMMSVESWAASSHGDTTFILKLDLRSNLPQHTRMIDAQVYFADALGKQIGGINLDRDAPVSVGPFSQELHLGTALNIARLLRINAEDVVVSTCTRAVIYEDGTKETFE